MALSSLSVKNIQVALFKEFRKRGWRVFSTNTKAFQNEADFIGITPSRFVTEFEIKRSRADYFAELQAKTTKHERLQKGRLPINYFYFVCEEELIKKSEVPDYCGLIYVKRGISKTSPYIVKVVKVAPRLHSKRTTDFLIITALKSIMNKYFSMIEEKE